MDYRIAITLLSLWFTIYACRQLCKCKCFSLVIVYTKYFDSGTQILGLRAVSVNTWSLDTTGCRSSLASQNHFCGSGSSLQDNYRSFRKPHQCRQRVHWRISGELQPLLGDDMSHLTSWSTLHGDLIKVISSVLKLKSLKLVRTKTETSFRQL